MHLWLIKVKLVSLCGGRDWCRILQALMVAWVLQLRWNGKHHAAGSKQLLSFTLDTHKGLSSLCLWINIIFVLAAPKHSVSYLLMAGEGEDRLIYQLYLHCTRITLAIRRFSLLDPSVLREQRAWISASSLQVSNPQLAAIFLAAISGASS